MKLGRSFLGLYSSFLIIFIIAGWLLDEVWRGYLKQDIDSYTGYKTLLHALSDYAARNPYDEWDTIIEGAAKKYNLPLTLGDVGDFDENHFAEREQIESGNTVVHYDDDSVILLHAIGDSNKLLALGPTKMPTRPRVEAVMRAVILSVIALLILILLWPITRDLDRLKAAATAFGTGDLKARAGTPKSAMLGATINAFNMMASHIKRLVDAHKELTNAVSHELRTPLARSKFAIQILEGIDDREKQEKYLQQIKSDIHELEELINEMLVYASFDSDKPAINISRHSVKSIIDNQLAQHSNFIDQIEVEIQSGDFEVNCDSHFIERAVSNYITNAIKYGGDKVLIEAKYDNEYATLVVHDNGPGVGKEFKEIAFDAFSRAESSRNKETGGFGLGLAIVQRVMEWHEGLAFVGDSSLGGAEFGLKWPKDLENT
ncbi:ATP-binding protein [Thalassotalea atypica]|uniref:ATP-binding protein n=1 Tax=Thalassotalea atypica TaxID=2054316 RepID=UPI0025722EA8|nr:ATP-binding protein [Thalassotalea atypica]